MEKSQIGESLVEWWIPIVGSVEVPGEKSSTGHHKQIHPYFSLSIEDADLKSGRKRAGVSNQQTTSLHHSRRAVATQMLFNNRVLLTTEINQKNKKSLLSQLVSDLIPVTICSLKGPKDICPRSLLSLQN